MMSPRTSPEERPLGKTGRRGFRVAASGSPGPLRDPLALASASRLIIRRRRRRRGERERRARLVSCRRFVSIRARAAARPRRAVALAPRVRGPRRAPRRARGDGFEGGGGRERRRRRARVRARAALRRRYRARRPRRPPAASCELHLQASASRRDRRGRRDRRSSPPAFRSAFGGGVRGGRVRARGVALGVRARAPRSGGARAVPAGVGGAAGGNLSSINRRVGGRERRRSRRRRQRRRQGEDGDGGAASRAEATNTNTKTKTRKTRTRTRTPGRKRRRRRKKAQGGGGEHRGRRSPRARHQARARAATLQRALEPPRRRERPGRRFRRRRRRFRRSSRIQMAILRRRADKGGAPQVKFAARAALSSSRGPPPRCADDRFRRRSGGRDAAGLGYLSEAARVFRPDARAAPQRGGGGGGGGELWRRTSSEEPAGADPSLSGRRSRRKPLDARRCAATAARFPHARGSRGADEHVRFVGRAARRVGDRCVERRGRGVVRVGGTTRRGW